MADLGETTVDGLKIRRAANAPDEAVRQGELDPALGLKANAADVTEAIADAIHDPVTVPDSNQTLALSISASQALTGEVSIAPGAITQAASESETDDFAHPVIAAQELQLAKTQVSSVVAQLRAADETVLATGTLSVDYSTDTTTGVVTILEGSNLITSATQHVRVAYACAEILDGPGLQSTEGGLDIQYGTTNNTVARGDHTHANDHVAATGVDGTTVIVTVTDQAVGAEVKLAIDSALTTTGGLAVDRDEFATANHTHDDATTEAAGLMTPEQVTALDGLVAADVTAVADTNTVALTRTDGEITADVREGWGLDSDAEGLKVDNTVVAALEHDHNVASGVTGVDVVAGGTGYTAATVAFSGGGGTGAAATAVVAGGAVTSITVDDPGYGYTSEPDVEISGDGSDATALATIEDGVGFATPDMASQVITNTAAIAAQAVTLAAKADTTYVDAQDDALQSAIDGKAATSHAHAQADVTDLVDDLGDLTSALGDKADTDHTHSLATPSADGFMAKEDKDTFNCIQRVLNTQSEALQVMSSLRLESPMTGASYQCAMTLDSDAVVIGGEAGQTYDIVIRVRGVTELKDYTGGVTTGRINTGGTPADNMHNIWQLDISSPAQTLYLNAAAEGEITGDTILVVLDYETTIQAASGATLTLSMDSRDALQLRNTVLSVEGVSPYPAIYDGQFAQADAVNVTNYCSFKFLFGDAATTPAMGGATTLDGVTTRESPGTSQPGTEPPGTPGGTNFIDLPREFQRLDLIEDGEANGDVTEILVDGTTLWVGGNFNRWANINSSGLAKLDKHGCYDPLFLIGGGFSQGVRFIRKSGTGVLVGTVRDSLFQGSTAARPAWLVNADGSVNDTFTCPFVLNEVDDEALGVDRLIGAAVLDSGNVALLTSRVLNLLDSAGVVLMQKVGTDRFNALLEAGSEKVLLSSHAYSDADVEQTYDTLARPKGLRLVNFSSGASNPQAMGDVDAVWALNTNAGSGAESSCGNAVMSPDGAYFIAGNARGNYNSPNTSWNVELLGNLFLQSQAFDSVSWTKVGTLDVTANSDTAPDSTETADTVADGDAVDLSYAYEDVDVESGIRYVMSVHIKKDTDQTRFPLFRMEYSGGTEANDCYAYFNTETGATLAGGTIAVGDFTVAVTDLGTYWRLSLSSTNSKAATSIRCYLYPAYASTWGSPAQSLTGSVVLWGAQLRKDAWNDTYAATTTTQLIPGNTSANSDRFRGLYKIKVNGKEDEDWACNITLSEVGHVTPFAIDGKNRTYIGGPVATISGTTVTPWRLYRLTEDGALDKEYPHFTDQVLVARLLSTGQLAVGGAFTNYGAVKVGRFCILNPDGTLADQPDVPIISSDIEPDVEENPDAKDWIWVDQNYNPHIVKVWDDVLDRWVPISQGATAAQLPAPALTAPSYVAPTTVTISVVGHTDAIIYYTTDGSTPDSTDTRYTAPIVVNGAMTIKAMAIKPGYTDSNVASLGISVAGTQIASPVTFDPPTGTMAPVSVTLNCALSGATIRYTTDGTDPDSGSTTYTVPIEVTEATTIKAYASKVDYTDSIITSAHYDDVIQNSQIINIQFKAIDGPEKTGTAAVGHDSGDQWNYIATGQLAASNLIDAEGSTTDADMAVQAPGSLAAYANEYQAAPNDNLLKSAQHLSGNYDMEDGLVSYWNMGAAPCSNDVVGAPTLAILSETQTIEAGKIGDCVNFGTDPGDEGAMCVSATDDPAVNIGMTDFTFRLWLKPTQAPGAGVEFTIIDKLSGNRGYRLSLNSDRKLRFYYGQDSTYNIDLLSNDALTLDVFSRVVVTGIRLGENMTVSLLVNNGTIAQDSSYIDESTDNVEQFTIGSISASDYFRGSFDEIGIWDRALTANELTIDWNSGAGTGYPGASTPYVSWSVLLSSLQAGFYDIYAYGSDVTLSGAASGNGNHTASDTWADTPWVLGTQYSRFLNVAVVAGDNLTLTAGGTDAELHGLQIVRKPMAQDRAPAPVFTPTYGETSSFTLAPSVAINTAYTIKYRTDGGAWQTYTGAVAINPAVTTTAEAYIEAVGHLDSIIASAFYGPGQYPQLPDYRVIVVSGVANTSFTGVNSIEVYARGPMLLQLIMGTGTSDPGPGGVKFQTVGYINRVGGGYFNYQNQPEDFATVSCGSLSDFVQVTARIIASKAGYRNREILVDFTIIAPV